MRRITTLALGAFCLWVASGTLGVTAAIADEEVKEMVFQVEGMR